MSDTFIRKLELFGPLPEEDKTFIRGITQASRRIPAHSQVITEGDEPSDVNLIAEGIALRCKDLAEGRRQIFAYLFPGDFCDLHVFVLREMDHSIETLTRCRIVTISREKILQILERPLLARALWWATLVDEATLREWVVNMGQRRAEVRLAHFFCEVNLRLSAIDGVKDGGIPLPVTQTELAETLGFSVVHCNRSLQYLREKGLIAFKSGHLKIPDVRALHNTLDSIQITCTFPAESMTARQL